MCSSNFFMKLKASFFVSLIELLALFFFSVANLLNLERSDLLLVISKNFLFIFF